MLHACRERTALNPSTAFAGNVSLCLGVVVGVQVITRALVHHWDERSAKLAAFKAKYPECTGVLGIVLKLLEGIDNRRTLFLVRRSPCLHAL